MTREAQVKRDRRSSSIARNCHRGRQFPFPSFGPDDGSAHQGAASGIVGMSRREARKGPSIPALQLPAGSLRVKDRIPDISGWRAYAIEVPGHGTAQVHVVDGRKGWFRVLGVNAWGRDEQGLLQNRIHTGEPLATYRNPTGESRTVYFIVDTLDADMTGEEFTIEVTRGRVGIAEPV